MPFSGDKLRAIREAAGIERAELAEATGTTRQYISHLENGVRENPGYDLVEKLARALGVDCTSFAESEVGEETTNKTAEPSPSAKPKRGRPKKSDEA